MNNATKKIHLKPVFIILIVLVLIIVIPKTAKAMNGSNELNSFGVYSWQNLPLIQKVPGNKQLFGEKTIQIAKELGVGADSLMAIMDFESAGTFRADKWGGSGGKYVGLIQFGAAAAKELGTNQGYLSSLSNTDQLDYVNKYFRLWKKRLKLSKIDGIADLYLLVLYPGSVRQLDRNANLNIPGQQAHQLYTSDGRITKNSISAMFKKRYSNNIS